MKIISLVPSLTKTLFDLGLDKHQLVGRTKFCIHPENQVQNIPKIGGTKNMNVEKIKSLQPDLILASKEENVKEQIESLDKEFEVRLCDVATLEDNERLICDLGEILDQKQKAKDLNEKISQIFQNFNSACTGKVAYLIWQNPYMTIGGDTFINEILTQLGFENIFSDRTRYPEIKLSDLVEADFLFLSTEPFPFNENHVSDLQKKLPHLKIILVDGEAFSWSGSHISEYGGYYKSLCDQTQAQIGCI